MIDDIHAAVCNNYIVFTGMQTTIKLFGQKIFLNRCPGGHRLHRQRPQRVFEEDGAEEAAELSSR